ncbi:uncharacterized protein EV422DRAFT_508922 [Fimicolochytrium jonesii]|uniref:uncharacterized protein n=1 Tax=Fimicolochytrium jonesii TaxID=1396493 RepID=UPI0022FDD915|nr:uncharacterized protein EV422DRAFT_508922 [Fimicolochytrium jonesii]KAI8817613.1 hypothetical protein EV422DRAFT_508922 [Fimicolochytrium jonesii]
MSVCSVSPKTGPGLPSPSILETDELPELPSPAPLPDEPIGFEPLRRDGKEEHSDSPLALGDKRTSEYENNVVRPWKGVTDGLARVCFDCTVTVQAVYGNHDYDRTPIGVVPLTKADIFELVRYRGELARATPKAECAVTTDGKDINAAPLPSDSAENWKHESEVSKQTSAFPSPSPPSVSSPPFPVPTVSSIRSNPPLSCSTPSPFPNGRLSIPLVAVPPPTLYPIIPLHKRPSFSSRHHLSQGQAGAQPPSAGAAIAAG